VRPSSKEFSYLVDSTGFVVGQADSKTFSSFSIDSMSVDYGDRPGAVFEYHIIHPETLATNSSPSGQLTQHGRIQLFSHVNSERDNSAGKSRMTVLARGRMTVHDAPPGEVSVIRWFWPTKALANLAPLPNGMPDGRVSVTTIALLNPPTQSSAAVNFSTLHYISGLKRVAVDLSRLVLPNGFTETTWPGFDGVLNLPLSSEKVAKWRVVP
jgi:hypothetical protein